MEERKPRRLDADALWEYALESLRRALTRLANSGRNCAAAPNGTVTVKQSEDDFPILTVAGTAIGSLRECQPFGPKL